MGSSRRRWQPFVLAIIAILAVPAVAFAHLERPSYWPDPAPDTSVNPPAGGDFPTARSLGSAVRGEGPGEVRVVCKGRDGKRSLRKAYRSIRRAQTKGFRIRPSQPKIFYTRKKAKRMKRWNRKLAKNCGYKHIQPAIDDSGNNDRVVIMPGRYLEPDARKQPSNDPRCNPSMLQKDASGDDTPSYEYQVTCPHDQNLVYVQGRALAGDPLPEPRSDRRGIPEQELGECVRCNLQVEGSGPRPVDVIIDAGSDYEGKGPDAKPNDHAKHVVFRADRADGFVGRNLLFRGGLEFGFYVEETDGVLLDRTKFYWNADYGHLSFTTDHNLIQNCDGYGSGDAVIYPGAAPETGSQSSDFYPDAPRANTIVRKCDMRGSHLGYSGSMGNAVRITDNHIYGNATGIASDTLSSAGHPGFPTDAIQIDNNFIYSNNFPIFDEDSPVEPLVGAGTGIGITFAGVNDVRVHDNWFFDNWRHATMLFAVPDALTSFGGPEGDVFPGVSCLTADAGISTSCGNHHFDNKLGQIPPGFEFPKALDQFGTPHGTLTGGTTRLPNGIDFWWDEFVSNRGNCWFNNYGPDGSPGSVTGSGDAGRSPAPEPNPLPHCENGQEQWGSVGTGDPAKEAYLVDCAEGPDEDTGPLDCDWWTVPPRPGSPEARAKQRAFMEAAREYNASPEGQRMRERMEALVAGSS